MSQIPELLGDVALASDELFAARESARAEAIAAIRAMETALVEALGGETLKGLREVAPGYPAARARCFAAKDAGRPYEPLPEPRGGGDGREVLVVTSRGRLEMAKTVVRAGRVVVQTRWAEDGDLLVEDVEHLPRLFAQLLGEHVARSRRTTSRLIRLESVARQISAALVA